MNAIRTLVMLLVASVPAVAQTLPASPGPNYNPRSTNGVFDLMVRVDSDTYFYLQGDQITYRKMGGQNPTNTGSVYTQPIPRAVFGTFNMNTIMGRGTVELVEEPSAANDYTAVVRINDSARGANRYHVRLEWTWNPADPSSPPGGGRNGTRAVLGNISDPRDYDRDRQGEFIFRGRIDGVTAYHIRSDQVRSQVISARAPRGEVFAFSQPLPDRHFESFELVDVQGRGRVDLVEEPWEGNDYTAVVRIEDDRGGSAEYSFRLVWQR